MKWEHALSLTTSLCLGILFLVLTLLGTPRVVAQSTTVSTETGLSAIELNDPSRLEDPQYLRQTGAYLRQLTFAELMRDSLLRNYDNQWHLAKMRSALGAFTNQAVLNYWLHDIAVDQLENYGCKNVGRILDLYYQHCTDTAFLREVREMYSRDSALYFDHEIVTYKTVGGFNLDAHVFKPDGWKKSDRRPAIVFFHGGSWYQGTPLWLFPISKRYAELGIVSVAAEYRLYDRHGTTPLECVTDARSIIRWVRQHADSLGVDPHKIVAWGASAGGHIAMCTAIPNLLDEPTDDTTISSAPNALVLYYACFDPTLDLWFVSQVKPRIDPKESSPLHNIKPGFPSTLILHGTLDRNCPFYTAQQFYDGMASAGNRCELLALEGAGHIFVMDPEYRAQAARAMRQFLVSLGYLQEDKE